MLTISIFICLIALIFIGLPIAISLCLTSIIFLFILVDPTEIFIVSQKLITSLDSFPLLAIPFFIFSGVLLAECGAARKLVNFVNYIFQNFRGGLGIASVFGCALFATLSGSSPATLIAVGSIMFPALVSNGYSKKMAVGILSTSGTLGILIPPSIVLIIYAVTTSQSAGKLFLAGVIPGILLTLILSSFIFYKSKSEINEKKDFSFIEFVNLFKTALPTFALILIIIVGIYGGFFTPTEAAAVSVFFSFIISISAKDNLSLKQLKNTFINGSISSSSLLFVITSAILFSYLLSVINLPNDLFDFFDDNQFGKFEFLIILNLVLIIFGQFMDPSSIILIVAPLILPISNSLGIDPIHLGIIMTVNMEIGLISPPVGLNLFAAKNVSNMNIKLICYSVLPWLMILLLFLAIICYFPQLSLWLPNKFYN